MEGKNLIYKLFISFIYYFNLLEITLFGIQFYFPLKLSKNIFNIKMMKRLQCYFGRIKVSLTQSLVLH